MRSRFISEKRSFIPQSVRRHSCEKNRLNPRYSLPSVFVLLAGRQRDPVRTIPPTVPYTPKRCGNNSRDNGWKIMNCK